MSEHTVIGVKTCVKHVAKTYLLSRRAHLTSEFVTVFHLLLVTVRHCALDCDNVTCCSERTVQGRQRAAGSVCNCRHLHNGRHFRRARALRPANTRPCGGDSKQSLDRHSRYDHRVCRHLGVVRRHGCPCCRQLRRRRG